MEALQKGETEEDSWKKDIKEDRRRRQERKGKGKMKEGKEVEEKREKKKIDWRAGVEKFKKGREEEKQVEEDKWKRLDSRKDIDKEMDGFWNVVEEKEVVKKKPKVEAMMLGIPAVRRGSRFWKR